MRLPVRGRGRGLGFRVPQTLRAGGGTRAGNTQRKEKHLVSSRFGAPCQETAAFFAAPCTPQ